MGLYQLQKPHTFVLGADYHKADVEISTTLARIIERAEEMKTKGTIWMSTAHGVYAVANYDGSGSVFNGSTTLTKASPEQILLLVDALWSRGAQELGAGEHAVGGLAFFRDDPWQRSPVIPRSQKPDGWVTAFSLANAMEMEFAPCELMSVGELVAQMKQLLTERITPDWEKRLLDRIEALGIAAVAAGPDIRAA